MNVEIQSLYVEDKMFGQYYVESVSLAVVHGSFEITDQFVLFCLFLQFVFDMCVCCVFYHLW
jgi:hypothetical protein